MLGSMDTSKPVTKKAADCSHFQKAISLLSVRDAKNLEQAMDAQLSAGKPESAAFERAWDEVMGF